MTIAQRLGGKNHRFSGKEKNGYLYKIPCVYVQVYYQPIDWQVKTLNFKREVFIWVPKSFLDNNDLQNHEAAMLNKVA